MLSLALGNDSFGYLGSCHFQSCICCLYMPDMSCLLVKGRVKEVWRANLLTCFYFPGAMKWFLPTEPHVSDISAHQEKTVSTLFFFFFFFLIGALPTANLACVACLLTFTKCTTVVQLASVKCARICLHVQSKSASLIIDKIFRQTFAVFPLTVFLTSKAVKILVLIL